jgi:hypothetical protein
VGLICSQCNRVNPPEASYCWFDGRILDQQHGASGPVDVGKKPFLTPFIFTSGQGCRNFDELALACYHERAESLSLLKQGHLARFLGGQGRGDLARAAQEACEFPDPDVGLDYFLGKLPGRSLTSPELAAEITELNLGALTPGQDRQVTLHLSNRGMRLLSGSIAVRGGDWLLLGEGTGSASKVFQFLDSLSVVVQVKGKLLRAGAKPLESKLVVESNGGQATIAVRATVPVKPFPDGSLAGAMSPRDAALKAKAAPREAAKLFEKGAVEAWYKANGWSYPVQGPTASGMGAVQQFFEALGLVKPPKVELSEPAIALRGDVGARLEHRLEARTGENRPVFASAVSDQPWLYAGKAILNGRVATIILVVSSVPDEPYQTLTAHVNVTANGLQRFVVPVTLAVNAPAVPSWVLQPLSAVPVEVKPSPPPALEVVPEVVPVPTLEPAAAEDQPDAEGRPGLLGGLDPGHWPRWAHVLPLCVLTLALVGVFFRDLFSRGTPSSPILQEESLPDNYPRIGVLFHDRPDALIDSPSMRFGLVVLTEKDPNNPRKRLRLTFDELGRSNNTCLKIDGAEELFGHAPGRWLFGNRALGQRPDGTERIGNASAWMLDGPKVAVTQQVEVIAGQQTGLLDTCLVRYTLANQDSRPHLVGLRFLLDTFIGANDGVPFTIPGEKRLCTTTQRFENARAVPDFIQALERDNLESPGTIAHLQLKLGGNLEAPSRVTLGAWPDGELATRGLAPQAKAQLTGWDVPVLPIHTLPPGDSAVTIYWDPKLLGPGQTRELGFTYGLGNVAAGEGKGQLALTVGGSFSPGGQFTVTAYVKDPQPNQTVRLEVPDGFRVLEGDEEQRVPPIPADAKSRNSPVTWKVRAANAGGKYSLRVTSSTGASQTYGLTIQTGTIF